jgi:hypothetical protein
MEHPDILLTIIKMLDFENIITMLYVNKHTNMIISYYDIYRKWMFIIKNNTNPVNIMINVCKQELIKCLNYMINYKNNPQYYCNVAIYEIAFRICYEIGNLDMMQILYAKNKHINIREYNNYYERKSHESKKIHILNWYTDIHVEDNNEIPLISTIDMHDLIIKNVDFKMEPKIINKIKIKCTDQERKNLLKHKIPKEYHNCICKEKFCRTCHYKLGGTNKTYSALLKQNAILKKKTLENMKSTDSFISRNQAINDHKKYITFDNRDRPWCIIINHKGIFIYTYSKDEIKPLCEVNYDKLLHCFENYIGYWYGYDTEETDSHGNTLLIYLANYVDVNNKMKYEYVAISYEIYKFILDEPIIDYITPLGNNECPYEIAYLENYIYFPIWDHVIVPDKLFKKSKIPKDASDLYLELWNMKISHRKVERQIITPRRHNLGSLTDI